MKSTPLSRGIFLSITAFSLVCNAYAGGSGTASDPYTGNKITELMDAGSSSIPAYYLVNTDITLKDSAGAGWITLGYKNPNNHLTVTSSFTTPCALWVGQKYDAGNCSVDIVGANASMNIASYVKLGMDSTHNSMTVSEGGKLSCTNFTVGYGADGGDPSKGYDNTLVIKDEGSSLTIKTGAELEGMLQIGLYGGRNSLSILKGAECHIEGKGGVLIGWGQFRDPSLAGDNSITVSGDNSLLETAGTVSIGGFYASGNTLTIEDGGLVCIGAKPNVSASDTVSDNYIRFEGGYLAVAGDVTSAINEQIKSGIYLVWDDEQSAWVHGTADNLTVVYCADAAKAESLTAHGDFKGYSNLADRTLVARKSDLPDVDANPFPWGDRIHDYGNNAYYSSWYGWFYSPAATPDYIMSYTFDSWQYIDPSSTPDDLWGYDYKLKAWFYTNKGSLVNKMIYNCSISDWQKIGK